MPNSGSRTGPGVTPTESESLLLLARPSDEGALAYCLDHLAPGTAPESVPVVVLADRAPSPVHAAWDREWTPGAFVAVGDSTRSGAGQQSTDSAVRSTDPTVPVALTTIPTTITATGDLGSIGQTIDGCVERWSASGYRPVVCVDALATLIERDSIEGVYRFLYVLLHRVEAMGGAAHVHADPGRHEEEILRTFSSMFDRVISFQDGSEPLR